MGGVGTLPGIDLEWIRDAYILHESLTIPNHTNH